ncbi:MAG: DUF2752 domain-containing protein [Phycisphaeraceae bacterium]|nr:DUF2752 domain-containing protein [Phycisphaeraceae bacterium]
MAVSMSSSAPPAPPMVSAQWLSLGERLASAVVAVVALAVLLIAARLEPSPFGIGTHQQLGLPACSWPLAFGLPCPSCGMTTAFAHAADGHFIAAIKAQPFGALLALATAMAVVVGAFAAITGTRVLTLFSPLLSKAGAIAAVVALLAAWGYKIIEYRAALI